MTYGLLLGSTVSVIHFLLNEMYHRDIAASTKLQQWFWRFCCTRCQHTV